MEILFNVSLSIFIAIFIQITHTIPQMYLGQYSMVPITLDAAICGLFYVKMLLNRNSRLEAAPKQDTGINIKNVSSHTHSR
uniref:Uncharacterized protein n=1 Tax=Ditylenchus dipsaci TaxID=166011 RepID=A0A915DMV9_9BILA